MGIIKYFVTFAAQELYKKGKKVDKNLPECCLVMV
jgi:hypothetical protein